MENRACKEHYDYRQGFNVIVRNLLRHSKGQEHVVLGERDWGRETLLIATLIAR